MTPERQAIIEREAEQLLKPFTQAAREAIEAGLYGARDAQLAAALLALAYTIRPSNKASRDLAKIQADRITDLEAELTEARKINTEDEATLRRLLAEACEIIEANCTGFSNRVEEMLAEGDV
jgi:hypothetical protein